MKTVLCILEERVSAAMGGVAGGQRCAAIVRPTTDPKFGDYQANGVMGLAKQLKTDKRQATEMQEAFFRAYPRIPKFMEKLVDIADSRGAHPYVKTLTGRRIYIPELLESSYGLRQSGVRKAGNAPIQGGAFDIMKIGMTNVRCHFLEHSEMWNYHIRCVNNLHDEVTYEVSEDLVGVVGPIVQRELENAYKLKVPLVAEPKLGYTWAECK